MELCPLVFVVYDGIQNSIFASQVIQPLLKKLAHDPNLIIWIVTFEENISQAQKLAKILSPTPRIQFRIFKKYPFIGIFNLRFATYTLKRWLKQFPQYELIARGPLAGFICKYALTEKACTQLIIQARGLLTQEYIFSIGQKNQIFRSRLWHRWKIFQFNRIEKNIYANNNNTHAYLIEAVSQALKQYLIDEFKSDPEKIIIAFQDIPQKIDPEQKLKWRTATRLQLRISPEASVFCYNGTVKPWQCPHETLTFFKEEYKKNNKSFLLILTSNVSEFETLVKEFNLDKDTYSILTVPHTQIYKYLAACDIGIVLRTPHMINWTSRPVKVLEYQAAGLTIVHNNTIAYLDEHI